MISSHLAPADARRVFPCWDEPAFKASFALTVTVPRAFLAVSNMPIAKGEPVNATVGGRSAAARAAETVRLEADLKARALPAIDDWIRKRNRD